MKTHKVFLAAGFAACIGMSMAHDADTLAFYAFKEGAPETSPIGLTITNDAGAAYSGSLDLGTAAQENAPLYKSDAPGVFVFDADVYGATVLCEHPQSIYFGAGGGNQKIEFADLATAISSNDCYTVEFFLKLSPEDKARGSWASLMEMNCGMLYNPKQQNITPAEQALAGTPQTTKVLFTGNQGQNFYTYVKSATYHPILNQATYNKSAYYNTGATYFDGYWHHYAMTYDASTHKLSHCLDYGLAEGSYTTTNSVLEASNPLDLGSGGFKGWVSCLRVSKKVRGKSEFLRCSSEPTYLPETVFHWRLDGENGESAQAVSNRCAVNILKGQYLELSSGTLDGHGTVVAWTNGEDVAVFPTYTNEIPLVRKPVVMYGNEEIGEDAGSMKFTAKTRTTEVYAVSGDGLTLAGADHYPISSGSFTMEAWMKLDYPAWKTKMIDSGNGESASVKRLTLFGMYNAGYHHEWQLMLNYQSDGYKLKLNAYDKNYKGYEGQVRPTVMYLMDSAWHHFAVVYDDSNRKFSAYVDGEELASFVIDYPFAPHVKAPHYYIGHGLNNCAFDGLVDEVRLVRRALSPSEFLSFRRRDIGMMLIYK